MREITYLKAINEAVDEEMARDPKVYVLGEDVRIWGAPFGEFMGLHDKYGPERVLDTPISETAIMGSSIGAAATGMRPIANIMFANFLSVCGDELLNQLQIRYIHGGQVKLPLTIMSITGAGFSGGLAHCECRDGLLMGTRSIKFVLPSTPYDAKGLLKTSIRDDNPVVFLYHGYMLFNAFKGEVPEEEYLLPLGKADVKREGSDVTVVATALMVHRALAAAEKLQEKGINIEVIDPRTLVPLDKQTILNSVRKTGKLVIMTEEPKTASAAGEIAAIVAEEAFDVLKSPIKRVCGPDTPLPFTPSLENAWVPDEDKLIKAVTEIA